MVGLVAMHQNFKTTLLILSITFLSACSAPVKEKLVNEPKAEKEIVVLGDKYWTLDFTYFYKGKEVKTVISQYDHRRDCFEALFALQKEASKKPFSSGGGLCKKLFVDGQERDHKDHLGYR